MASDINVTGSAVPMMRSVKETAEIFGITEYYARQLATTGKVAAVKIGRGGKILINQRSVADYFANSYISGNSENK